ncbi:hypothetical protein [Nonomuraea typhae]|uniref:hypothetical protein n=1 Tax=Nonomuraea typhae TaxID=2603600 RepID=UPI0012FB9C7A|nr:hypothetical protein [Nonomuraea typhae]
MFLDNGREEGAGVPGVVDGGLGGEAEDGGEVERLGAVGEGLFELPVEAQASEGRGLAAQPSLDEVDGAARARSVGAHLVDEQVRVGGVGQRVRR